MTINIKCFLTTEMYIMLNEKQRIFIESVFVKYNPVFNVPYFYIGKQINVGNFMGHIFRDYIYSYYSLSLLLFSNILF